MLFSGIKIVRGIICFAFIGVCLSGCKATNTELSNTHKTQEIKKDTVPAKSEPTIANKNIKMDISNFKPLKDRFLKDNFTMNITGADPRSIVNEPNKSPLTVSGNYDLDQNGQSDVISISLKNASERISIKINDVLQDFIADSTNMTGEVHVIDLDSNDKFLELAIFDDGPSADPHYIFFRFDGKKIHRIGSLDNGALANGEGKIISELNICRFEPSFYSAWYEIENNELVLRNNDVKKHFGKEYTFKGGEAYFIPTKEMPKNFEPKWDNPRKFEAGKLKLIDVYFYPGSRTLNFYFVEFPNGDKGMLYFWIGD